MLSLSQAIKSGVGYTMHEVSLHAEVLSLLNDSRNVLSEVYGCLLQLDWEGKISCGASALFFLLRAELLVYS